MQLDKDTVHAKSSIAKSLENQPGGYGWRVEYGDGEEHRLAGSGQYATSRNFISGNAYHQDGLTSANVGMEGALVVADGALFLSRRINSSFSVVDAGAPDVEVYSQNRLVGKTGKSGKILVPNIGPYQKNTIRIEADDLATMRRCPIRKRKRWLPETAAAWCVSA
jgi:outer membrane usher protein